MKQVNLGTSGKKASAVVCGCMRYNELSVAELAELLQTAVEEGVTLFDHADIYGGGTCEELFGKAWKETGLRREDVLIQSKCGIVPGKMFDFSKEHILNSVDGILKRLDMEYLDMLLLHRPDALMEPEEVAEAFDTLEQSGKVRMFGVSNQRPMQIELLKKCVKQPVIANQVQFGAAHTGMIRGGLEVNMLTDGAVDRDGSLLEYCRVHDITMQAWSPFLFGFFKGVFIGNEEKFGKLNSVLSELAEKYGSTPTGIATAWILRHPAGMQMIAGTTKKARLKEICDAADLVITREEWYRIYMAAGNMLP